MVEGEDGLPQVPHDTQVCTRAMTRNKSSFPGRCPQSAKQHTSIIRFQSIERLWDFVRPRRGRKETSLSKQEGLSRCPGAFQQRTGSGSLQATLHKEDAGGERTAGLFSLTLAPVFLPLLLEESIVSVHSTERERER